MPTFKMNSMGPQYRYEILPLNTPDEDPLWAQYVDLFRLGLLGHRPSPEGVAVFRRHRRASEAVLGMVTAEGPGLDGREPVAGFSACVSSLNCGAHPVLVWIINTVAVKPSHRRRGLLGLMMRHQLDEARRRGVPVAMLTASEATIYGRFGFGAASRFTEVEVDLTRFAFRAEVEVSEGRIEFVDPGFLEEHFDRIAATHHKRHLGSIAPLAMHKLIDTGAWDGEAQGPSARLRAAVHFSEAGIPDGYAVFTYKGWDEPRTCHVQRVCTADPAVERALWRVIASIDLVQRLTAQRYLGDPLPLSLVDEWAVRITEIGDYWLRIVDLPAATAARRFEADGAITIAVDDAMGYVEGTWRLSAEGGFGQAEPVRDGATVRMGVDTLARLWLGDRTAEELALGGLISGTRAGLAALSTLLRTGQRPFNPWHF